MDGVDVGRNELCANIGWHRNHARKALVAPGKQVISVTAITRRNRLIATGRELEHMNLASRPVDLDERSRG